VSTTNPDAVLIAALEAAVGSEHVITSSADMEGYTTDWSRRFSGPAVAVVRPANTAEVASLVGICAEFCVPMLAQGGNTGLVGGSVPAATGTPPVIISLRRLNSLAPVDELSGQVTAGAGVLLGDVQRHARAAGWEYGVDLAARDSATIGGTVATNAGGIHVISQGMTRAQVTGIEAVLADGSVISHLAGLDKDNTGYDLAGLLCGSEGTLGVITAVRVRLHRPAGRTTVALIGVDSYESAVALIHSGATPGYRLRAAEVIDACGMRLVQEVAGLPWPLAAQWPLVVLLEVIDGGTGDGLAISLDADAVVGLEPGEQERLWQYRERQSEAFSSLGVIHKLDVSVPLESLAACCAELNNVVAEFADVREFGVFGHLGDGNIHVEIYGPDADDMAVDIAVLECVSAYSGSISAEHGVGRAKAELLNLSRSPAEIAAMRAIKSALDPQGLFNPGVILD
jgi:FAD/FMN-containing dehydrogenase